MTDTPKSRFVTGLDLGQARDFTAVAVLEQTEVTAPDVPDRRVFHYAVRHLERLPLGTPYTAVCKHMVRLFAGPPLTDTMLAVDQTGVGRAVFDLLDESGIQADLRPITITGGHNATPGERAGWLVPKKDLVGVLQVLLQARRLKVAPHLPAAATLVEELLAFQVKITSAANETFGTWRDGRHDDLVLAVAVAAWAGEHLAWRRAEVWT